MENVCFTSFRDHMLGQPRLGNNKSVPSLTQEEVQEWRDQVNVGDNLVVVATGEVDHNEVVGMVEEKLGNLPRVGVPLDDSEAVFTPSCIHVRDDDVDLLHMGMFLQAPSRMHEDYFGFLLLKHIIGDFDPARDDILNDPDLQYNSFNARLGHYEDLAVS